MQKADTCAALNQKLSSELGSDQAQITQIQNQLKVTMVNEILFPEGGYSLSPKGEQTLAKIARAGYDKPWIHVQRVANRVLHGGHPIAPDEVIERWRRVMALLAAAFSKADTPVFDNSAENYPIASLRMRLSPRNCV